MALQGARHGLPEISSPPLGIELRKVQSSLAAMPGDPGNDGELREVYKLTGIRAIVDQEDLKQVLSVPLLARQEVFGLMFAGRRGYVPFGEASLNLAQRLSSRVVGAVKRGREIGR